MRGELGEGRGIRPLSEHGVTVWGHCADGGRLGFSGPLCASAPAPRPLAESGPEPGRLCSGPCSRPDTRQRPPECRHPCRVPVAIKAEGIPQPPGQAPGVNQDSQARGPSTLRPRNVRPDVAPWAELCVMPLRVVSGERVATCCRSARTNMEWYSLLPAPGECTHQLLQDRGGRAACFLSGGTVRAQCRRLLGQADTWHKHLDRT